MIKIRLFCSAGMSTSLMVNKMKAAAQEQGIEADIVAFPESTMDVNSNGADVVLLGPQVRFMLQKAEKLLAPKGIPVAVIDMKDYGLMNGANVLAKAIEMKNNNN